MKIKPYAETHMDGIVTMENNPFKGINIAAGDFGIQIAEDGRVWVCINGLAFIRFKPTNKYHAVGAKLKGGDR